jgi:AcrR family transcriptional regulator
MTTIPDTRTRIVATAERLFRVYGYQKTTVADIAKELEMSPANVYRFFQSKKELVEAVAHLLTGGVEEIAASIARAKNEPAAARLRRFIAEVSRMHAERYVADSKMHEMVAIAMAEDWPMVRAHVERLTGILEGIIADGIGSGEFRKGDPKLLAQCVHKSMVTVCHPMMIAKCGMEETAAMVPPMTDFILAALRA